MGRADVLLRLLQLVGMDSPQAVDPLLAGLNADDESRPLADQIVDRLIDGDATRYDLYAQARREAGVRNPYASPGDDPGHPDAYAGALGTFLTQWIALEAELREVPAPVATIALSNRPGAVSALALVRQLAADPDPELRALAREIDLLRNLRNRAVHGVQPPPADQLRDAAWALESAVARLKDRRGEVQGVLPVASLADR